MRIILSLLLIAHLTTGVGSSRAADNKVEEDLRNAAETVSLAVVRIETGAQHATTGVIVSEKGYVVWPGLAGGDKEFAVALSSGELASAINCGWSNEWQVGLLKLQGDRKWPHVEFGSTEDANTGDRCFEIGYRATKDEEGGVPLSPVMRYGQLTHISPCHWFLTDLEPTKNYEYGAGTFDADGKLLGISVAGVSRDHHISTAAEMFDLHWESLIDGKNLDWVRYPPSKESLYRTLSEPNQLDETGMVRRSEIPQWNRTEEATVSDDEFEAARHVAARTTVRIMKRGERRSLDTWSGVLVSSEGHVTTCAHTQQLPGEELVVVLPDNRKVSAVALGTNWVSDIGLIKITESGPWDYASLGDSSVIGPNDAVLFAGFPVPRVDPLPPVSTDVLPLQETPYVGWSGEFVCAMRPDSALWGGASGGGIFDRDGRLVCVLLGPNQGLRIEVYRAQERYLKHAKPAQSETVRRERH